MELFLLHARKICFIIYLEAVVLSAVVWNINNWFNYKKYISQIIIPYNQVNTTNYKEIKYKLLSNIYSDVIKLV